MIVTNRKDSNVSVRLQNHYTIDSGINGKLTTPIIVLFILTLVKIVETPKEITEETDTGSIPIDTEREEKLF